MTRPLLVSKLQRRIFRGIGAMPVEPSLEHGAFEPEATAAMGEAFELPAKSFTTSASFKWCVTSLPTNYCGGAQGRA